MEIVPQDVQVSSQLTSQLVEGCIRLTERIIELFSWKRPSSPLPEHIDTVTVSSSHNLFQKIREEVCVLWGLSGPILDERQASLSRPFSAALHFVTLNK